MPRNLVVAVFLATLAACADEPTQPASQPSTQNYPIPPVKPHLPQASAQQAIFTVCLPLALNL